MKMIFKAFFKHLFGAAYERLVRTLFVYLIVLAYRWFKDSDCIAHVIFYGGGIYYWRNVAGAFFRRECCPYAEHEDAAL